MKFRIVVGMVAFSFVSAWSLNKNQSIEFSQSLNRNASTDADAAFHNPAGVAFLPANGFHLGGGNQFVMQERTIDEPSALLSANGTTDYTGKIHAWAFPTLHAVYRHDDWSFFVHGGPLGGGGVGEYDQGLPQFDNLVLGYASQIAPVVKAQVDTFYQRNLAAAGFPGLHVTDGPTQAVVFQRSISFTGDEMTLGGTLGGAYRILPVLSASAAYRFSYARNSYKGSAHLSSAVFHGSQGMPQADISGGSVDTILSANTTHVIDSLWQDVDVDVVRTGTAHSVVFGLDFKPDEVWNVGVRFEWNGELELENQTSTLVAPDSLKPYLAAYADGAKSKITEPMILAGGVSWKGVRNLTIESSWTYGFAENVDHDGAEANYHNSLFGGVGARYMITPALEGSVGYAHDWAFKDDAARDEIDPDLPTHFLTGGIGYQANSRLRVDGGVMVGIMPDGNGTSAASGQQQKMSNQHLSFGIGLEWSPQI